MITTICSENKSIPQFNKNVNDIEILRSMEPQDRRECLITNNMRLAMLVAQKFGHEEDYESVAMIGLIRAADTFDLDKGSCFSTYAARVIQNQILMYLRKSKRQIQAISFETVIAGTEETLTVKDMLSYEDGQLTRLEQAEQRKELHEVICSLPDRECTIICLLYGLGEKIHTQKQVAERLGISQSYVSRLEKSILKKMKSKLKNYR